MDAEEHAEHPAAPAEDAEEWAAPTSRGEVATWFSRGVGLVAGGLLAYGLITGFLAAGSVVVLFFFALLLASALEPLVDQLRGNRLPFGRGASLLLVYAAFFAAVLVLGLLIVPGALNQVGDLTDALPAALQRAKEATLNLQPETLRTSLGAIIDAAIAALKPGPAPGVGQVVSQAQAIGTIAGSALTILALVYFWMTERARLQRFVLSFLRPDQRAGTRQTWNAVELRLGNWVRGQLTLMAALAIMTGIAYSVLGLPSALLLALLAGIAEVVPIVGPAIGAVPAILVAVALKPDVLVFVIIAYVVIQVIEGNILVPIVMRNAIGVSPLLIILSLLVGTAVGGFLGALVAVPVIAGVEAMLEHFQDREVPVAQDSAAAKASSDEEMTGDDPAEAAPGTARQAGFYSRWTSRLDQALRRAASTLAGVVARAKRKPR
jgi:predicted PurR-regulated permease PerM